jgi:hypothetical protein
MHSLTQLITPHMTLRHHQHALLLWCCFVNTASASGPAPLVYSSDDPEVEMFFYPSTTSNGLGSVRDRAATFSWFSPQPGFPDITGSGIDPGRRGSFIVAGDTSAMIPVGLDRSRYQIESVKVTLTMLGSIGETPGGPYDGTPDSIFDVLSGADADPGRPVEMWGVGFDGAYETFGFNGETDPKYFNSGDRRWPVSGGFISGPYEVYPTDATGADVSNNMFAMGYSATASGNVTGGIFDPTPFAVGKVHDSLGAEYAPGAHVTQGDVFEFDVDLAMPDIAEYLQASLSLGNVGFFFSSLHEPNGHDGDVYYPDFYLDNVANGPNPYGAGPTIEVVVTILDEVLLAGDYDHNGVVNELDYNIWSATYGATVTPGGGADGNGDGFINAADYTVLRDSMSLAPAIAVPEPGAAQMAGMFAVTAAFFGWMRWYIGPLLPDEGADD